MTYRLPHGQRNLRAPCVLCRSSKNIEIHHVKAIRKNKSKDFLTQIIQRMNRKQVPLCRNCHRKIHRGDYGDGRISLKKLASDPLNNVKKTLN